MEDKAHNELINQFPKPNVPTLHVPELDKWLVLIQGKHSLANLRWEQDLQVTERNYMDAAGPLCVLLQHLKSDPQAVQVREAINLVLKSVRLLGHAVATVNKHRRQDIVESTHINDITELGKHSDSVQKFLFGESKAKDLNFVGELDEKVSKAIQPQSKKNQFKRKSSRGNSSSNTHGQNDHSSHQALSRSRNQSSQSFNRKRPYNNRPFRRAPSQGKPYLGGVDQRLAFKQKSNMQPSQAAGETKVSLPHTHSLSPLPFVYLNLESILRVGKLIKKKVFSPELGTLNIRPVDSQHCEGLQTRAYRGSQAVNASPHPLKASQLALVEGEIASLLDKRAIQQVPYHSNLFCSNLPIHLGHQKLLCFQFKNVTYQFKCLPFGLTSAPHVFTKVLKSLIVYVRRLGLRICIYQDDMLTLSQLPVSGNTFRRQKITATVVVIVSPCF